MSSRAHARQSARASLRASEEIKTRGGIESCAHARNPTTMRTHYKGLCVKLDIKGEDELAVVRRLFELTIEHMQDQHRAQIAALERQIEELKGQIAAMQQEVTPTNPGP